MSAPPPDRILMRAVAEVVINEEKARAAADRELADRIAVLEARPVEKSDAGESLLVPRELAAQLESVRRLLDEPLPVIAPPEPPEPVRRLTGAMVTRDGYLAVVYSDGSSEQLGNVCGPPGQDGVSVVGSARNEAGEVMFTLSNGTVLTP